MIVVWIVLIAPLILTGAALTWAASWKRTLLFGARVDPVFRNSAEARRLLRRHRIVVVYATAGAILLSSLALRYNLVPLIALSPVLIALAGFLSYRAGWMVAREHSAPGTPIRTASLAPDAEEGLSGGILAWSGPYLILAAVALLLYARWDEIPPRVVVHWGISGPDRWADKSWRSVGGVLVIGFWVQVLLTTIALGIAKGTRRAVNASGWNAQHRRINLQLLLAVSYAVTLMLANIAVTPVVGDHTHMPVSPWAGPIVLLGIIAIACWRAFQHLGDADDESEATPDDCWKWGEFYYNPSDAAAFVPKRSGFGYTINFAHPVSWAIGGIVLLLPVFILLFAS